MTRFELLRKKKLIVIFIGIFQKKKIVFIFISLLGIQESAFWRHPNMSMNYRLCSNQSPLVKALFIIITIRS